ncbi:MAG: hypothetical protein ABEJ81_05655 [Haloferacaceae archaeon]
MNKHFEDARYYLGRATEHAKEGVREELEPIEKRFRDMTGEEAEPEPSRLDRVQGDLKDLQGRAQGETKEAVGKARERIREYRGQKSAE